MRGLKYALDFVGYIDNASHPTRGAWIEMNCVEVRQGFKTLSPAMKELERLIRAGLLVHGGNPVLRWMFGNLTVKTDENENVRPVKDKSTGRIDGIVALVIAMARAMLHEDDGVSIYEERGLLEV